MLGYKRPQHSEFEHTIDALRHLLSQLYDPNALRMLVMEGGTALVCAIVFVETGMFAGFFLPGDSLLVTAGVLAGAGDLKLASLLVLVTGSAIAGDQVGYAVGWKAGESLYRKKDSRFFKHKHLEEAHDFYERYGGKTIIMARFIPIIRTFCPPVAGAAKMNYTRYLTYDIFGGLLWVWSMVLAGFTLGRSVPNIERKLHYVIAIVVILSLMPAAFHAWNVRRKKLAATQTSD
jgi:membrane-associated protein